MSAINLCTILSSSIRIIKAHSRHFLALSVLFLLPLSFFLTVFPTLQHLLLQSTHLNSVTLLRQSYSHHPTPLDSKTLILTLIYAVFILICSHCAVGSISYSVFHGFYGRPVKFISSIKSILSSFFPLLVTVFSGIIVSGFYMIFAVLVFLVIKMVKSSGFGHFDDDSPYSTLFTVVFFIVSSVLLIAPFLALIYIQVNWLLASVIVVVESSWGLEPLKRSTNLIKGNRLVSFSMLLLYSGLIGLSIGANYIWMNTVVGNDGDGWRSWVFVLQIVETSALLTMLFLYSIAANTVLYMYCRGVHGELATEIAEEFAKDYVSLPFDDDRVPHLVSVAYT